MDASLLDDLLWETLKSRRLRLIVVEVVIVGIGRQQGGFLYGRASGCCIVVNRRDDNGVVGCDLRHDW